MVQKVFLVLDVIIERALGHIQFLGDFVERCAVEALLIEEPGAGLVEGFLLLPILLVPVETLRRTVEDLGGLAYSATEKLYASNAES